MRGHAVQHLLQCAGIASMLRLFLYCAHDAVVMLLQFCCESVQTKGLQCSVARYPRCCAFWIKNEGMRANSPWREVHPGSGSTSAVQQSRPNSPETDQARNPALLLLQSGHLGAKGRVFLQLATHLVAPQALPLVLLPLLPALHGAVCVTPDQCNVVPTSIQLRVHILWYRVPTKVATCAATGAVACVAVSADTALGWAGQ